jgi:MFS family permease
MSPGIGLADDKPWYAYVTRYQWLVLFIASAGWVFDQYESQIFVLTKDRIFGEILHAEGPALKSWGDWLYAVFLLGSTLGGLIAGSLADRYGHLGFSTLRACSVFGWRRSRVSRSERTGDTGS